MQFVKPRETTASLGKSESAQSDIMLPRHSVGPCLQWTVFSLSMLWSAGV